MPIDFYYYSTAITGLFCYFFLRSKWPGWIFLPFFFIFLRLAIDIGIHPLIQILAGIETEIKKNDIILPASPNQILPAIWLLVTGSFSILIGMVFVRVLRTNTPAPAHVPIKLHRTQTGYQAARTIFVFGVAMNLVAIYFASKGISILEVASTRAVFTNKAAYENFIFNYAWLLRNTIYVGAWGMVIFAGRSKQRARYGAMAVFISIAIEPIYGGREKAVFAVIAAYLIYAYGNKSLSVKFIIIFAVTGLLSLVMLSSVRYGVSFDKSIFMVLQSIFNSRSINEAAFAMEYFPEKIDFLNGSSLKASLSHLIPGLKAEDSLNIWRFLESVFIEQHRRATSIGGETISTHVESFMNFGYAGVIVLGIVYGLIFGLIFEWNRVNRFNPLVYLFAVGAITAFIPGLFRKMPAEIAVLPITYLVPIGYIAAKIAGHKALRAFQTIIALLLLSIVTYKITGASVVKYGMFVMIVALYKASLSNINRYTRSLVHRNRINYSGLPPE